ncbi:MAG: ABC transporter ATP-binding protein [Chloroflexota bacterium]|nr:ABC transporter ATP-binding protein [Chloroflexota bacterium]
MNKAIVEIGALGKTYPKGDVEALKYVNLVVEEGEFLSILGPSGSGKTTLLNMIGALDKPTRGKIVVGGVDLIEVKNLDCFRSKKVGFVFQLHNLVPTLSAWENVQLPMYALKMNARQRKQKAIELLDLVRLGDRINHTASMLSGGERQRVALARALANDPCLVLADEPTGTLDPDTGEKIIEMMHTLNRSYKMTFIVVTHDQLVAKSANRIVYLVNGIMDDNRLRTFGCFIEQPVDQDVYSEVA